MANENKGATTAMTATTITRNEQYNSFEITFAGKPDEQTRNTLKANGYRWHGQRKIWYGYKDIADQLNGAQIENDSPKTQNSETTSRRPSLWERTRTVALPGYGTPDNELRKQAQTIIDNERTAGKICGYDKAVAAVIRKHLRERFPEVKISVTSGGAGYLDNCDIRIIASPYKRELVKGNPSAHDWREQCDHYEDSDELQAVLNYCNALHNAFDNDDGDIYADYGAHHDLYGRAEISYKYEETEQTADIKADCADFAERKAAHEQAEQERRDREFEERQRQAEIDRQRAEEQRKRDEQISAEIMEHITVTDLNEAEQIAITDLIGGIAKENDLDELRQTIADGHATHTDAVITRNVTFTSAELCAAFCNMFMRDWDFLRGMGGSTTEDIRMNDINELNKLTAEQRDKIKWYSNNCVAVYLDGELILVIDPQGYDYARYVYVWDGDHSAAQSATYYKNTLRGQSEAAPTFYCPAPLAEQLDGAKLQEGETFTALKVDGWTITTQRITGKLISTKPTQYAQYSDAARLEYIPQGKRKPHYIITHSGEDFILYRGELPEIPHDMAYRQVSESMFENMTAGKHAHDFIKIAIDYYKSLGYSPVIDLIAR